MKTMRFVAVSTYLALCCCAAMTSPAPLKVSKQEEALWLRRVIPLPQEVAIRGKCEIPVGEVRLRLRKQAGDVEKNAAAQLASLLTQQTGNGNDKGQFEILIGVCDAKGQIEDVTLPDAARLGSLPNPEQAYLIRPIGTNRLVLTARNAAGVYYAAVTLHQLLKSKCQADTLTIPLVTVTDWPDLAERGEWGGSSLGDIKWLAYHKMNLVEAHAESLKVTEDGKGVATICPQHLETGRLCGLKLVPILTHLDQLMRTGVFKMYPELQGRGKSARHPGLDTVLAPCFSQPKMIDILADWMNSLARQKGVTDICVWLTEHHVQCGCEQCQQAGQYVLETRAILQSWRIARKQYPHLGLRILLTQGSYATNDKVLAEVPAEVGVSYYHGGQTYNSSRDPLIYPVLEEYLAKGRWLGCYPQLTASWRIVCPWSGPQFIKYRMTEFVQKKLKCLCGYAVPNNRLYDFNITAAAEWSWNVDGRDEREFAIAWATRQGLRDPEAAADWAVMLGPVGWDVYGSGIPYPWFSGALGKKFKEQSPLRLGEGMFRYFPTVDHIAEDLAVTEKALEIAAKLNSPTILAETRVLQGYVKMAKEIYGVSKLIRAKKPLTDRERTQLQTTLARLSQAGQQTTNSMREWEQSVRPGIGGSRFKDTLDFIGNTVSTIEKEAEKLMAGN